MYSEFHSKESSHDINCLLQTLGKFSYLVRGDLTESLLGRLNAGIEALRKLGGRLAYVETAEASLKIFPALHGRQCESCNLFTVTASLHRFRIYHSAAMPVPAAEIDALLFQLQRRLVETGEWERLKSLFSAKLNESGWADDLRHHSKGLTRNTYNVIFLANSRQSALETWVSYPSSP